MIRLDHKPECLSFFIESFPVFYVNCKWYTLTRDYISYKGYPLDGRLVYNTAKKLNKVEEYNRAKSRRSI